MPRASAEPPMNGRTTRPGRTQQCRRPRSRRPGPGRDGERQRHEDAGQQQAEPADEQRVDTRSPRAAWATARTRPRRRRCRSDNLPRKREHVAGALGHQPGRRRGTPRIRPRAAPARGTAAAKPRGPLVEVEDLLVEQAAEGEQPMMATARNGSATQMRRSVRDLPDDAPRTRPRTAAPPRCRRPRRSTPMALRSKWPRIGSRSRKRHHHEHEVTARRTPRTAPANRDCRRSDRRPAGRGTAPSALAERWTAYTRGRAGMS